MLSLERIENFKFFKKCVSIRTLDYTREHFSLNASWFSSARKSWKNWFGKKYKKSHTCEEGGENLRTSFWHLLMNFEKPKKSDFWENEKVAGDIILHMCTKNHNHMRYSSWDTEWNRIFCHFGSFLPFHSPSLTTQKNKTLKKWKKHLEMPSF